ncbi:hypothetical protein FKM82_004531 [Ascaphus truei]
MTLRKERGNDTKLHTCFRVWIGNMPDTHNVPGLEENAHLCYYNVTFLKTRRNVLFRGYKPSLSNGLFPGIFTVRTPKETPGQHFEGLDLLTSLLAPKGTRSSRSLVEEIGSPNEFADEEEEEFDWQIEQTPFEQSAADALNSHCSYGFGNLRAGVFTRLQDELNDVIDLRDPDVTPASERTQRRLAVESAKFDPDHYLADVFEDNAIQLLLKYQPWWVVALDSESSPLPNSQEKPVPFTAEEKEQMRKFTNKSHLLDKKSRHLAYLGLIDILLAYCYEICVTEGEKNVESAWNIRKLSGTLSWFENYTSIKDVLVSFGRRVLCYPLYRHFHLVTKAVRNTGSLLKMGKAAVLKCLLDIHAIFQANDPAYILNDLYVTDYCIWIQKAKSKKVTALSDCLQASSVSKADLGFELEELEDAARLVQEEEMLASDTVPRQPRALLESEASSSDETSSSDSSSETEGSVSDGDTSSGSKDLELRASRNALQRNRAVTLIEDIETRQKADGISEVSLKSTSVPLEVVEELGDQMCTAIILSECPQGQAAANGDSQGDKGTNCAIKLAESAAKPHTARDFLEVTPRKNPLLIVALSDEDDKLVE